MIPTLPSQAKLLSILRNNQLQTPLGRAKVLLFVINCDLKRESGLYSRHEESYSVETRHRVIFTRHI